MKKIFLASLSLFLLAITIQSCSDSVENTFKDYSDEEYAIISKRLNLPGEIYDYTDNFEDEFFTSHLGEESIHARRNSHKATLGRVLFYDT